MAKIKVSHLVVDYGERQMCSPSQEAINLTNEDKESLLVHNISVKTINQNREVFHFLAKDAFFIAAGNS